MKFVNQKYSNKTEINNNKKYIFWYVQPKLQLPFDELDLVSLDPAIQLLVLEWQNVKESESQKTKIYFCFSSSSILILFFQILVFETFSLSTT